MTRHKDLKKAISQMADGSKSAFHTFYLGSSQFVYSSARLLYGDHAAACRFMVDFYQYLYLHVPEYRPAQDLEKWISRLIMDRFSQLSIGKPVEKTSVREQMSAGTAVLETAERERVWRLLGERMHFPKEAQKKRGRNHMLFLVPVLLLAVLLTFRYRDIILEKLQNAASLENSDENNEDENDKNSEDTEYGEGKDEGAANGSPDSDPGTQNPDVDSDGASLTDDGTLTQINENDGGASLRSPDGQTSAPQTPTVDTPTVDTPSPTAPTIDEPTIDTPTANNPAANSPGFGLSSGMTGQNGSDISDLDNYELEPYYGDSLTQ